MMEEARRQRHAPVRAAVIAQKAVAIAIEAVAPVRLANLASIRLGTNLTKPDGQNSNYWLHFMPDDVKNNVHLQFVFKDYLTELIDEYVQDFWPTLLRGRREDYLFPGLRQGAKGKVSFSVEISKYIYKATGLKMTVHQFRHAAGAIILKNRPGEFELVRQILGHRSISTTMRCYAPQRKQHPYRSLPVQEWPEADRKALEEACRPGVRLKPGGRASHFAEASLRDFHHPIRCIFGLLAEEGSSQSEGTGCGSSDPVRRRSLRCRAESESLFRYDMELCL
jgi:hypothetical protein